MEKVLWMMRFVKMFTKIHVFVYFWKNIEIFILKSKLTIFLLHIICDEKIEKLIHIPTMQYVSIYFRNE